MTDATPKDYQQILHQIHADVVLERLRDYVDPDGDGPAKAATDLNYLAHHLLVGDAPASIHSENIENLLKDDAIRELIKQSIRNLTTAREES